jgi:ribosomal protein S18 acetylase RimI-like enzyme
MIKYVTEVKDSQFLSIVDMYDDTNMFVGLGRAREIEKITSAIKKSYKYVFAFEGNICIGGGRLISDGECYGWIHDVAVRSDYRKQGIGQQIVLKLMEDDKHLLIGLTSSFEAIEFYDKLGFNKHKTAMAIYPGKSDYLIYK